MLLAGIIYTYKNQCDDMTYTLNDKLAISPEGRQLQLIEKQNQQFMAALCILKYNRLVLMCGTTIISKYWVITTAHCCTNVLTYDINKLKITSNSARWRLGLIHDVEKVIVHEKYTPATVTHNVCLIRVKTPFGERFEAPLSLAGAQYMYIANTTAITTGWMSDSDQMDHLYMVDVILVPFQRCKKIHKNSLIDATMVCGRNYDNQVGKCNFDSGGPLIQKNVIIGLVSFETDCASGEYPRVFTRIGYFQQWIKQIEANTKVRIGVKFKL